MKTTTNTGIHSMSIWTTITPERQYLSLLATCVMILKATIRNTKDSLNWPFQLNTDMGGTVGVNSGNHRTLFLKPTP